MPLAPTILQHDGFGAANFHHIVRKGLARHAAWQTPYAVHDDRVSGLGSGPSAPSPPARSSSGARNTRNGSRHGAGSARTGMQMTAARLRKWLSAVRRSLQPLVGRPARLGAAERFLRAEHRPLRAQRCRVAGPGEKLTLDHATFCNESSEGFECQCGTLRLPQLCARCRQKFGGVAGESARPHQADCRPTPMTMRCCQFQRGCKMMMLRIKSP